MAGRRLCRLLRNCFLRGLNSSAPLTRSKYVNQQQSENLASPAFKWLFGAGAGVPFGSGKERGGQMFRRHQLHRGEKLLPSRKGMSNQELVLYSRARAQDSLTFADSPITSEMTIRSVAEKAEAWLEGFAAGQLGAERKRDFD